MLPFGVFADFRFGRFGKEQIRIFTGASRENPSPILECNATPCRAKKVRSRVLSVSVSANVEGAALEVQTNMQVSK